MAKINAKQIDVAGLASTSENNLVQAKTDGLYMALAAPEYVARQYVSSVSGNDANDGSRANPLKTLARALERLPENTSGEIYLKEGEVFPMRNGADPDWGATVTHIGRLLNTSLKTVLISSYGPQTDFLDSIAPNVTTYLPFLVGTQYINRPILEFGHYMYNGNPVGTAMILGQANGALATIRLCEIRWAASTRAAVTASNKPFTAIGYQAAINSANGALQGVILPSPLTAGDGTVLAYPVICYGQFNPWQVSIPVETSIWCVASGVNEITFGESGSTVVGNNGVTYNTLPNTATTNFASRVAGVLKDTNGVVRNVACNINL